MNSILCRMGWHRGNRGISWSWITNGKIDQTGKKFLCCVYCGTEKVINDEPGGLQIHPEIPPRLFFKMAADKTKEGN